MAHGTSLVHVIWHFIRPRESLQAVLNPVLPALVEMIGVSCGQLCSPYPGMGWGWGGGVMGDQWERDNTFLWNNRRVQPAAVVPQGHLPSVGGGGGGERGLLLAVPWEQRTQ